MNQVQRREAWLDVIRVVYGGVPGGQPEGDADQLRAIAGWLDAIDDASDKALDGRSTTGRDIQRSLREIADRIEAKGGTEWKFMRLRRRSG